MALITVSGYPCSGKTTRALQIKDYFEAKLAASDYIGPTYAVVLIDDAGVNVTRASYSDSLAEKPARASVFAAVQRALGPDNLVICDGLNYIKGYRYQMYCAAREAKARPLTIFVAAPADKCKEWHDARQSDRYKQETFDNLIQRFEEPSSMVRWDSPLFALPWDEPDIPLEELWLAATQGTLKPPNTATIAVPRPPSDSLRTLTKTITTLITDVLALLAISPGSTTFRIPARDPFTRPIELSLPPNRTPTLAELQRLKRQFEAMQRKALSHGGSAGVVGDWTEQNVAEGFVRFLEGSWGLSD